MEFIDVEGKKHTPSSSDTVVFRPGVYVFAKNEEGKFLMVVDRASGKWEFPGGGLDVGEDLSECALREVREETGYGIRLDFTQPFFVSSQLSYYRHKKLFAHSLHYFFEGVISGERQEQQFAEGEVIEEVGFKSLEEIKKLELLPFQQKAFEFYLEK